MWKRHNDALGVSMSAPFFLPLYCGQSMKVRLQPPSGTELAAFSPILPPAAITQVMLLANPLKVCQLCHTDAVQREDRKLFRAAYNSSVFWGGFCFYIVVDILLFCIIFIY